MDIRIWAAIVTVAAGSAFAWVQPQGVARGTTIVAAQAAPMPSAARLRSPARALRVDGSVAVPGATGPALLTLRVGTAAYVHPITLPTFSIPVPAAPANAMVSIEIEAPGRKYAAIIGTMRRTSAKAGGDAILDADELDRVRITAIGTALHAYVDQRLGDRLPLSDHEHEQAVRAVGEEVAVAGYLLQALGDGRLSLPADWSTGYELISDRQGMVDFIRANPRTYEEWLEFARAPTGIALPLSAFGADTAMLSSRPYGEVDLGVRHAQVLRRTDGSAWYFTGDSAADAPSVLSAMDAETVRITHDVPRRLSYYEPVYGEPGVEPGRVRVDMDEQHVSFRRLFAGDRYSLLAVMRQVRHTYPDQPERLPWDVTFTSIVHAYDLDASSSPLRPAEIVGTKTLPRFCMQTDAFGAHALSDCEYAEAAFFANGQGQLKELGDKVTATMQPRSSGFAQQLFSWQTPPRGRRGPLRIQSGTAHVEMWRLSGDHGIASQMVYLATGPAPDGTLRVVAGQTTMLDANGAPGFTSASLLGPWKYGTFEQERNEDFWFSTQDWSVFTRTADGVTREDVTYADPAASSRVRPSSWQLVDFATPLAPHARLYETRYVGLYGRHYRNCTDALADGQVRCKLDRVRYFRPMAQSGNRTYGIEELYINTADFDKPVQASRWPRLNYHERIPAGPALPEAPFRRTPAVGATPVFESR